MVHDERLPATTPALVSEPSVRDDPSAPARFRLLLQALVPLVLLAAAPPLHAQVVVGEIVGRSGSPIDEASIALLDADGATVAVGRSDAEGGFRVSASAPGEFTLHVTRRGYRPVTGGPYTLEDGIALEVLVVLHPAPAALDPIEVEVEGSRSRRLDLAGFYERERMGSGYFFDREDIENLRTTHLAEFLDRRVPRLKMDRRVRLFGPDAVRNPPLAFDEVGRFCSPALWVDGVLVRTGGAGAEPIRVDDWVGPNAAEAIEFYGGPASAPLEFSASSRCAVIVVWTRGGR